VVPLYREGGVRVVLCGHEHNFQYAENDGIACVQAGAAGKVRTDPPEQFAAAGTVAWGPDAHCLLGELDGDTLRLTPYGATDGAGDPRPIALCTPDGTPWPGPIELRLATAPGRAAD
jgi:tartrate-resistant acid phosphatase type 5